MVTLGGLAIAGCVSDRTDEAVLTESFESALDGWDTRASIGPEVDVEDFHWEIERSNEQAYDGDQSLRIFTEGTYDDGTAWITRPLDLPDADTYTVEVQAWSESESFNHLRDLVMVLAPESPDVEEDFPPPGMNSTGISGTDFGGLREPLWRAEGWERYVFEWEPEQPPDTAHLAVGVSVVWESDLAHFIDAIRVTAD